MKKIMILAFTMLMLVGCSGGENKTPSASKEMEFLEKASEKFEKTMAIRQEEFDSYMESPCIENGEIKIEEFQNHKVAQVNRVNEKDVFLYEIELLDDGDWISIEKYTDEKKEIGTEETFVYENDICSDYDILKGISISDNSIKLLMEDIEKMGKYYTIKLEETDESYILTRSLSDVKGYNDALMKENGGHKPSLVMEDGNQMEFDFIRSNDEYIFDKDYNLIESHHIFAEDYGNNLIANIKTNWKYKKLDKMKYSYEEVMELLSQAKQQAE